MESKQYYYSDGKERLGPFTIEELKDKSLTNKTLIWFEGEIFWHPLSSFPTLASELKASLKNEEKTSSPPPLPKIPPPLPISSEHKTLNRPNKSKTRVFLVVWTAINLFALVMSYAGVAFFNVESHPETQKFWPFVDFTETYFTRPDDAPTTPGSFYRATENTNFNGIFYQYDWSEFAVYVGAVWIMFLLAKYPGTTKDGSV